MHNQETIILNFKAITKRDTTCVIKFIPKQHNVFQSEPFIHLQLL